MVHSRNVNNGQSMNWRHDWLKANNVSYASVVKKNVSNTVDVQVENYPWTTTVYGNSKSEQHDTNRDSKAVCARLVNSQGHGACRKNKGSLCKNVNINRKNVCLQRNTGFET